MKIASISEDGCEAVLAFRGPGEVLGELVLGEARVDRARLDAGVAVDALLGVDVEHLDLVVVGLVGRRVDAVDRADLDAGVVLGADAGLGDDVGHGGRSGRDRTRLPARARCSPAPPGCSDRRCCGASRARRAGPLPRPRPAAPRRRARAGPDRDRRPGRSRRLPPCAARRRTVVHLAGSDRDQPRGTIEELDGLRDLAPGCGPPSAPASSTSCFFSTPLGATPHHPRASHRAKALAERAVARRALATTTSPARSSTRPATAGSRGSTACLLPAVPAGRRAAARARSRSGPRTSPTACWPRWSAGDDAHARFELAGPESLTHREVVELAPARRAAAAAGCSPIPLALLRAARCAATRRSPARPRWRPGTRPSCSRSR